MKRILLFLLILLFLCLTKTSFCQSINRIVDSVIPIIHAEKSETRKVDLYNRLSQGLWLGGYYDRALKDADSALTLAKKINYQKGIAAAYNNVGGVSYQQANYAEAIKNYLISLKIRLEIGDKQEATFSYNNMGNIYLAEGNYADALKNYFAALKIGEELHDDGIISNSYCGIGNVYTEQGNYDEALKDYLECLRIWKKDEPDGHGIFLAYINIGNVYLKQGHYSEALKSFLDCLDLMKIKAGDRISTSTCYGNIGNVYMLQRKYPEALKYYMMALDYQKQMNYKYGIADSYVNIGEIYFNLEKRAEAKDYLNRGLLLAKESGNRNIVKDAYSKLSSLDSAMGNINEAYYYYRQYVQMRDSISNEESNKQISQLKIQYETDKKDQQIKTQELRNGILQTQIYYSIAISLMIIGIILLLFYLYSLRNRKKKKEYEHMLTDFELTILKSQLNPHFISNSLSTIKTMIDNEPEKAGQFLSKFSRLMRRVLEQNEQRFISLREELDTEELYLQIESLKLRFGLDYHFDHDESIDLDELLVPPLILQPTLENAIKHGLSAKKEKGHIEIKIKIENGLLKFIVTDNGIGQTIKLPASNSENMAKKSFGLNITRKRVEMLSKELEKEGYIDLKFMEGLTVAEIALPLDYS